MDENLDWRTVGNNWDTILVSAMRAPPFTALLDTLEKAYAARTIYPARMDVFNAFRFTPPETVRVVILGQDPYINTGQAHGLAFSVQVGQPPPPSLQNIFKERASDLGLCPPFHGCLEGWARQGVLLLNTVLTVESGKSQSHAGQGWEAFTDAVLQHLGQRDSPMCFLLWGRPAQKKEVFLTNPRHLILKAPHPSPLSAHGGFFGSRPFSKVNAYLEANGLPPIHW